MPYRSPIVFWLLRWLRPRERAVLRQVNLARRALGKTPLKQLPTGQPGQMRRCPLAQALDGLVGRYGVAYASHDTARRVARVWGTAYEPVPDATSFTSHPNWPVSCRTTTCMLFLDWPCVQLPR
ncbi:hypothetical protein [Rhodothermus marinus]|uniref:hypothetical protein n=1 Tax=Rhodothermus marinus TaxID=29549 RepID=UPI000B22DD4D|nr:hypothetical protein [Rhodothermus marinus]